jgi:hypothetical protein
MIVANTTAPSKAKADPEAVSQMFVEYVKTRTATTSQALVADIVDLGTRMAATKDDLLAQTA